MTATVAQALSWAFDRLGRRRKADSALLDAEWLLTDALGTSRAKLKAHPERRLTAAERCDYASHIRRYVSGEPLAYIIGRQPFWKLDLAVDPRVLIPRPETELLVAAVLELGPDDPATALDLGTGCGAIALAIALERPRWQLLASDRSTDALRVAEQNYAELTGEKQMAQVRFRCSDWFCAIEERFDFIAANPPYVALDDPRYEGSGYEPVTALFPGYTGLEALRIIVAEAPSHLNRGGHLLVEHGTLQAPGVRDMMHAAGLADVETRRDLAGHDRITLGRMPDGERPPEEGSV